jgi:hypothetical protein
MAMVIALLVALLLAPAAAADVGFESASRSSAAPGEQVKVTVGCGFCFPPCVGRPGHRHPPGTMKGICMLDGRSRPPTGFGIWLTRSTHPLHRRGPSRPPRLPSFTYLGRAERASPRNGPGQHEIPRYVLRFRVPALPPAPYEYVLYCASCVAGPRGTVIESGPAPSIRLRIGPPSSSSSFPPQPSVFGGVAAAVALFAAGALLLRSRAIAISSP